MQGLVEPLIEAVNELKWKAPTKIQRESIPVALKGNDIIALAETGSGKTGAFALPILQSLLENPQRYFALVLTPTRELAFQIGEQFEALGSSIGVKCTVIVGGLDMVSQALQLAKKPHILVATPGRLVDHLENTKGFNLKAIKYLVMDEADRILNMDFEVELEKILKVVPRERRTFLFSATMTKQVKKLQRASLKDPVKVEVSNKYQTVENLKQYYVFIPVKYKDVYLVHILNELAGNSFMIFCSTCNNTVRVALMLRALGMAAVPLHGQMSQNKRLAALNKFKAKSRSILISTDVASRGLDIPHVDVVINLDIPTVSPFFGAFFRIFSDFSFFFSFFSDFSDLFSFFRLNRFVPKYLSEFPTPLDNKSILLIFFSFSCSIQRTTFIALVEQLVLAARVKPLPSSHSMTLNCINVLSIC